MHDEPQKPGEQLAMEALASVGLSIATLDTITASQEGADWYHQAVEQLCAMPASQQRQDALRVIVKAAEEKGLIDDPLPTPGFLMGDAWLEEFEQLGGTCRLVPDHGADGQEIIVLVTEIPAMAELADRAKLHELRRRLGENELSGDVIMRIISRSSWDDLHGPVA